MKVEDTTKEENTYISTASSVTTSATSEDIADSQKKKGTMVKIRGFLSGKSRRERKDKKTEAKNGAESATMEGKGEGDDQSTVYNVNVDEGSTDTKKAAENGLLNKDDDDDEETDFFNEHDAADKKYLLKLVLLLMDSNSRRFELLQLEFDSVQASVSDVLAQIPVAVTETCLKEQTYRGISSCDGKEKKPKDVLAKFCKGGDVMVAVAEDMTAADYVKLALPILSDPKVVAMVRDIQYEIKKCFHQNFLNHSCFS